LFCCVVQAGLGPLNLSGGLHFPYHRCPAYAFSDGFAVANYMKACAVRTVGDFDGYISMTPGSSGGTWNESVWASAVLRCVSWSSL
jgi:hypothetical protein